MEFDILPFCLRNNITVIAYSPLDKGRICLNSQTPLMQRLLLKYGKTFPQIALNWIVSKKCIPIPAARNTDHLISNAQSVFYMDDIDVFSLSNSIPEIQLVLPSKINVSLEGEGCRKTYKTIKEAKSNFLGFVPNPVQISNHLLEDNEIKPVRLVKTDNRFSLVEGRMRYWGWVIAFGDVPIPSIIRDHF